MNDQSVHAGDMHQSVVVTGDGNKVVLRFGKADDITVLERRQFRRPERRQQLAPDQRQRELDLLEPEAGTPTRFQRPWAVHVKAELATLLDLLAELNVSERGKFDRAVEAPERKPASPTPTRESRGSARAIVKYAKEADNFDTHASNLLPHVAALGSWLGTAGYALLKAHGIAP